MRRTMQYGNRSRPNARLRALGHRACLTIIIALALTATAVGATRGQEPGHAEHALGTVRFPVSCSEPAQREFNRAVALLHHMTYPQARQAFQQVAEIDSTCVMAHWGIAMTLFQPLWPTRPGPAELQRGWQEVQTARALGPKTERERQLVDAAKAFFEEPESRDYWARIHRWEQAMARAHEAFPQDPEVTAFYSLAHLAVAPVDTSTSGHSARAAELLLGVYERNPDHPGAMHYLVHANDATGREHESLAIVQKYAEAAPSNPHALHMPTHIYTRLGDWDLVIDGNLKAAEAALKYPAGDRGEFVWDEFPHAIEYVVYGYLQKGSDSAAAAELARLRATDRLEPSLKTAFHLSSIPARYALERRAWREAMALEPRQPASLEWDLFTWPEAVTWFARGLGAVHERDATAARQALARLTELEAAASRSGEALFARNVQILRLEVGAWLAHAERDTARALAQMREAAELEVATPKHAVTPGPTLPGYELLGDMLLELERPREALAAYKQSLELYPRRFNGLIGAARAAHAIGDEAAARAYYQELLDVAGESTERTAVAEARTFVARR